MRRLSLSLLCAIFASCATPRPTEYVNVVHHAWADFSTFGTYAWSDQSTLGTDDPSLDNAIIDALVRAAVEYELAVRRITRALRETDPDILVSYEVSVSPEQAASIGQRRVRVRVNVSYGDTGRLAWFGEMQTMVTVGLSAEERQELIRTFVERIMKEFHPLGG